MLPIYKAITLSAPPVACAAARPTATSTTNKLGNRVFLRFVNDANRLVTIQGDGAVPATARLAATDPDIFVLRRGALATFGVSSARCAHDARSGSDLAGPAAAGHLHHRGLRFRPRQDCRPGASLHDRVGHRRLRPGARISNRGMIRMNRLAICLSIAGIALAACGSEPEPDAAARCRRRGRVDAPRPPIRWHAWRGLSATASPAQRSTSATNSRETGSRHADRAAARAHSARRRRFHGGVVSRHGRYHAVRRAERELRRGGAGKPYLHTVSVLPDRGGVFYVAVVITTQIGDSNAGPHVSRSRSRSAMCRHSRRQRRKPMHRARRSSRPRPGKPRNPGKPRWERSKSHAFCRRSSKAP